ncbi:hypothetical protein H6G33_09970 [Calothrix sp. FACHB-1219]|uniref:SPFH domain-containing protein n=1 Tax=unclassified Calothrix TaxID=2619626 RepID=UPI0016899ABE|nr:MULTISPECIES: SPFH domain-containing protein [unclassified Calothrix]MBD2201673.1 hypothetical protein [Calothrix sp. FACHB-168]MBD2217359.1 hypothetical protein [Calothrix sp. FACHB-1219]
MDLRKVLLGSLVLSLVGCGTIINPGEKAYKVYLSGESRGFDKAVEITDGRAHEGIGEKVYFISTALKNVVYSAKATEGGTADQSIKFNAKGGVKATGNVAVSYQIADKVTIDGQEKDGGKLFLAAYKVDDDNFAQGALFEAVRKTINEVAVKYTIDSMMGADPSGKSLADFQGEIEKVLNERLITKGVQILSVTFTDGVDPISDSIRKSIENKQQAALEAEQTEARKKKAKGELEIEQIEAQKNKVKSGSLTPNLLRDKELDIIDKKWDGRLPDGGNGLTILKQQPAPKQQ